jgi:subtilisin family serine protease
MKRLLATLPFALALACGSQGASNASLEHGTAADAARTATAGNGRYLVVFKTDTLPASAAAQVRAAGGIVNRAFPKLGVVSAAGGPGFAAAMAKSSSVAAVGQERFVAAPEVMTLETVAADATAEAGPQPIDGYEIAYGWDMRRMNAPAVWAALPLATGDRVATVAVLDVGVMDNHPDLVGQWTVSKSTAYCSTSGGLNNTAGYPIYSTLIDFDAFPDWTPADGCTAAPTTYEWHGTHVASNIAAKFGGGRAIGVDPDARVAIYKVFDRYRYTDADGLHEDVGAFDGAMFSAIVDAVDSGIPVISMSLGSTAIRSNKSDNASWLAWNRVAKYANRGGAVVIASAGNAALDLNGAVAHLPSDIPTIISTSASAISKLVVDPTGTMYVPAPDAVDYLASYSNYGAASIDVTAPGGDCSPIDGCLRQYFIFGDYIFPSGAAGYAWSAGTSMATPHVSAVAAMVRALHPDWDPGTVRSWLRENAQDLGNPQAFGHGMCMADAVLH